MYRHLYTIANFFLYGPDLSYGHMGPIGSAVLTFIEYKHPNIHPDRQNIPTDNLDMKKTSLLTSLCLHSFPRAI